MMKLELLILFSISLQSASAALHIIKSQPNLDLDKDGDLNGPQFQDHKLGLKEEMMKKFPPCGKEEGWIYSKEFKSCYKPLEHVNYKEADEKCKSLGSEIVSIHSEAENQFVLDIFKSNTIEPSYFESLLLGATRINGAFQWSDGTPFDYHFWDKGEPNYWSGGEECVSMFINPVRWEFVNDHLGQWNDIFCWPSFKRSLCKKASFY